MVLLVGTPIYRVRDLEKEKRKATAKTKLIGSKSACKPFKSQIAAFEIQIAMVGTTFAEFGTGIAASESANTGTESQIAVIDRTNTGFNK